MAEDMTSGSGGFDDWLEGEPGPATDPYADLVDDDSTEELADWVAFADGRVPAKADAETPSIETDITPTGASFDDQPTEEIDRTPQRSRSPEQADPDTGEIDLTEVPQTEIALEGTRLVPADDPAPIPSAQDDPGAEISGDGTSLDGADTQGFDDEDTGEIEVIPIAPYGGFQDVPVEGFSDISDGGDPDVPDMWPTSGVPTDAGGPELFDLSEEGYLAGATREHSHLAEAIAIADEEATEQVAVAAPIPGIGETVVGFEDVVEAEGLRRARSRRSGDLIARVITGIILIVALAASLMWQPALVAFVVAIFVLGAGEFYTSLVRSDRKPIALFGFVGIIGASLGAFFWGAVAIPTAFFLAATLLLLFYAVVPGRSDPMGNLALTIAVMVWVGMGAYAMLIVKSDAYRPLVIGVVLTVVAMDIAQYFIGRLIGRTKLSPWVSPNKTVEGLAAGIVVALALGATLDFVEPFDLTSGLVLGAVVAVLAPMGDLAMSAAKRSLGLKDMGSVLPGHGGFLDRVDGLLFVIPAAWVTFMWAGIL